MRGAVLRKFCQVGAIEKHRKFISIPRDIVIVRADDDNSCLDDIVDNVDNDDDDGDGDGNEDEDDDDVDDRL